MGQIYQGINVEKIIKEFNIKNFIETGTGIGDSLDFMSKFKDINLYSVELMDELYDVLIEKFKAHNNITLIKGFSTAEVKKLLNIISSEPTIFWLDAHFPGADFNIRGLSYDSKIENSIRLPLEDELRAIANGTRDVKNDVIVIDDLRIYKDGPYEGGVWHERDTLGCSNIDFVKELFCETHTAYESYCQQGYITLIPKWYDGQCSELIIGNFKELE
jgi:hypothetical protein